MGTSPRRKAAPAPPPEPPRYRRARTLRRRHHLHSGLLQLLAATVAAALGFLLPHADVGTDIAAGQAIPMLVAAGGGIVTFIGVVFSLLYLVVQFGSTSFSPRLNLFRDSPVVRRAFAFYVGVVTYAFTAALAIGRHETTPGLVPFVGFLGVLVGVVLYGVLQAAALSSIELSSTLAQISRRGRETIDRLYAGPATAEPDDSSSRAVTTAVAALDAPVVRWPHPATVVQLIDVPRLVVAAQRAGAVVEYEVGPGQVIQEGAVLAVVRGATSPDLEREVLRATVVGDDRTFEQDPSLALRLLADIGLRALSPAVNDPTTAVQALDRIESLLRVLATRHLDVGDIVDDTGTLRVVLALPTWDDYLAVALDEMLALPDLLPTVSRRITRLLDEVAAISPPGRRHAADRRRTQVSGTGVQDLPGGAQGPVRDREPSGSGSGGVSPGEY